MLLPSTDTQLNVHTTLYQHNAAGIDITSHIKAGLTSSRVADFKSHLANAHFPEVDTLRDDVEDFASQFPTIGYEKETMRYQ